MIRKVRALRSGDRVALVAPASPLDRDVFERGLAELRDLGFDPSFDESVFERTGYLAGPAAQRAAALSSAWRDSTIAGIFALRGGYGSAQLLPLLDRTLIMRSDKPFVGCSDLTALLVYLTTCCSTVGFHGPMLVNLAGGESEYHRRSLLDALSPAGASRELSPESVEVIIPGEASGVLLGGTLTQLLASLSTPFAFAPPERFVLLLDDVGERPYRIDRMLTQLTQTGLLRRAVAVVCTEFPDCGDADGRDARGVIAERLADFRGPVLFGFPTGHTAGPLWTLPLGVEVTVMTAPRPRLVVEESAVL